MKFALYAALFSLTGCATRAPMAWRVDGRVLTPPQPVRPLLVKGKPCLTSLAIAARPRRGGTILTANASELSRQSPGWLGAWALQAEQSGCLAAGQGGEVAHRLLDSVPLDSAQRHRLWHPVLARNGYVNLGPENRLEVIVPILREGSTESETVSVSETAGGLNVDLKAAPAVLGVETTWYLLDDGTLRPTGPPPRRILFADKHARFWRLVYKADQSSVLVAADSPADLEQSTLALSAGGNDCPNCIAVPRSVGVNPFIAVLRNGVEARVPVGSNVRRLIRDAGKRPEDVTATLRIIKPYRGRMLPVKYDSTKSDILDLVLEGNEEIRW